MIGGVALLPQHQDAKKLVEYRIHNRDIEGPMIGELIHPPHVSILQCPFSDDIPTDDCLSEILDRLTRGGATQLAMTGIDYQPVGWLFLNLRLEEWLIELQDISLNVLSAYIDRDAIDGSKEMSSYTEHERESYLRFGYRYVGQSFRPHVTLGRIGDRDSVMPTLRSTFESAIGDWISTPRALVFYIAGQSGVVEQIVSARDWFSGNDGKVE